jgi:hypothetical protein
LVIVPAGIVVEIVHPLFPLPPEPEPVILPVKEIAFAEANPVAELALPVKLPVTLPVKLP